MDSRLLPIVIAALAIATLVANTHGTTEWRDTSSKAFNCSRSWRYDVSYNCTNYTMSDNTASEDRRCYSDEAKCDSVVDCSNFADEENCEGSDGWKTACDEIENDTKGLGFFQCKNKMCIFGCQRCDGVYKDCQDGSDEDDEHGKCDEATNRELASSSICLNFRKR